MDFVRPTANASLADWLDWLLQLHPEEIDLGIERVQSIAQKMSLYPFPAKVITVAGTNGKGSSAAMLSAVYAKQGYQVGFYSSPHLLKFNERIQFNNEMVSDVEITDAFVEIEQARGEVKLTFFEFATLAALWVFRQRRVDIAIMEVGLGGRLDAVNLLDADATLITAIDVDHEAWLGSDREKIAIEKAGVMRSGRLSVCSDSQVPLSLVDYADRHQVNLKTLEKAFFYQKKDQAWYFLAPELGENRRFPCPALQGDFQIQNAAGAVALVKWFNETLPVSNEAIASGLVSVKHPGRLQLWTQGAQTWLMDVAHNPQSAEVLAQYLTHQKIQFTALFSVLDDKEVRPMLLAVCPFVKMWHIADLQVPRAMSVKKIRSALLEVGVDSENIVEYAHISDAVATLCQSTESKVLAWGSFYTVAQTMAALGNE